ncbi:MAG TPA: hypothetical protein VFU30_05535 [Gaiellaceae bacterium]|nr:hypothetical protein [Gaiellaceae bacterium]
MKKIVVLLVVALAIPTSVAFAKSPKASTTHGKSNPMVMYILKGNLSSLVAANGATDGSITITITHANRHARQLVTNPATAMQFTVASNTRITFANGSPSATLAPDAKGMVKFRAPLHPALTNGATLATALPTMAKAFHVIVQSNG